MLWLEKKPHPRLWKYDNQIIASWINPLSELMIAFYIAINSFINVNLCTIYNVFIIYKSWNSIFSTAKKKYLQFLKIVFIGDWWYILEIMVLPEKLRWS